MARVKPGDVFNRLTIIEDSGKRTSNGTIIWKCQCECGNFTNVDSAKLKNGGIKSCGCYRRELATKDLTGKVFGRLIAIEPTGKSNDNHIIWKCECSCGNFCEVSSRRLLSGDTRSCGCLKRETDKRLGQERRKLLKGQRFGKLIVLEDLDETNDKREVLHLCQCDCGKIIKVSTYNLTSQNKISCGCLKQSKGELKIEELLKENNIQYINEYVDKNCKLSTGGYGRFDFLINNKYYIEYDGDIHFMPKGETRFTEENFKIIQQRDRDKNMYCFKNNIPLIRIPYTHYQNLCIEDLLLSTSSFLIKEELNES